MPAAAVRLPDGPPPGPPGAAAGAAHHLSNGPDGGSGWIYGLADKQVGAALNALHGDPARKWRIQALADVAAMSRSTFALRFRERVGAAPIGYLTRWRMLFAADRLVTTRDRIAVIAPALG